MQQEATANQGLDQGFNLDSYRALLEQLEASKRNQQRLLFFYKDWLGCIKGEYAYV